MGPVTIYDPSSGKIVHGNWNGSGAHMLQPYLDEGLAFADGASDPEIHYMPGGEKTDRPKLAPDTAAAPLTIDCAQTGGSVLFRNEAGEEVSESVEIDLMDPGSYDIVPPDPWRTQTITLT